MNDQVLHTPDVRCRTAFAEARMERQIHPKSIGQGPRPLMALDRHCPMKRYDRRSLANRLYDGGHPVDVKRERIEFHSFLHFLAYKRSLLRADLSRGLQIGLLFGDKATST